MAKAIKVEKEGVASEAQTSDREARWNAFVENYAKKNPVKFAAKKANKEFDTIPASFK